MKHHALEQILLAPLTPKHTLLLRLLQIELQHHESGAATNGKMIAKVPKPQRQLMRS
jgi:hypothetical protein